MDKNYISSKPSKGDKKIAKSIDVDKCIELKNHPPKYTKSKITDVRNITISTGKAFIKTFVKENNMRDIDEDEITSNFINDKNEIDASDNCRPKKVKFKEQKNYVFSPCEIVHCFKKNEVLNKIKEFVKIHVDHNKIFFDNCKIDPKIAEKILLMAININHIGNSNASHVGNGSAPLDIIVDDIGVDVGVVSANGLLTGEKSIMQNSSGAGAELEKLFLLEPDKALKLFAEELKKKYNNILNTNKKIKKIYYCMLICTKSNVYMIMLEVNTNNCNNICISKDINKHTKVNILTENFISNEFGVVKLYKSKKRLELRLNKSIIKNKFCIQLF